MTFLKTRPRSAACAAAMVGTLLALAGCQGMAPAGSERMAGGGMAGGSMGCCAMCHGSAGQTMQHGAAMHGHDHGHTHEGGGHLVQLSRKR